MPIFRTPDGKIVEEKTRRGDTATESGGNEHPTHKIDPPGTPPASSGEKSGEKSVDDFYDAPTVADKIPRPRSSFTPAAPVDDEKTRIHGRATPNEESGTESEQIDAMQDPLSGWLVIVSGPGKGNAVKLGYGLNSIGRSEQDRVNLSFGDSEISRNKHATLIYDPKQRKFYLQQGDGRNLVYINDKPVLQPTEIHSGCNIELGNTLLKFIAFCNEKFDWLDTQKEN